MRLTADTARFRGDDPDELVSASLACPMCLRAGTVEWELEPETYDQSVRCECRRCGQPWRVYVTDDQALRLGLMAVRAQ